MGERELSTTVSILRRTSPARYGAGIVSAVFIVGSIWLLVQAVTTETAGPDYYESAFDWVPPPPSLENMVERADVIVIGRVTGIEGNDFIGPTSTAGSPDSDSSPGIRYTIFTVHVDEYIYGSGPDTLLMRQMGDAVNNRWAREFPAPAFEEEMLIFLTRGPGNVWESDRGPWGRMVEDNGSLFYAWGGHGSPMEVPYLAGRTIAEARDEIAQVAAALEE